MQTQEKYKPAIIITNLVESQSQKSNIPHQMLPSTTTIHHKPHPTEQTITLLQQNHPNNTQPAHSQTIAQPYPSVNFPHHNIVTTQKLKQP